MSEFLNRNGSLKCPPNCGFAKSEVLTTKYSCHREGVLIGLATEDEKHQIQRLANLLTGLDVSSPRLPGGLLNLSNAPSQELHEMERVGSTERLVYAIRLFEPVLHLLRQ
ncbi:MAG TPA: hypothetical protein VED46_05215 [Alphaproteobacteria bacterium]|nr:hypothetical protein [Alphaproteobacteria bacterium]